MPNTDTEMPAAISRIIIPPEVQRDNPSETPQFRGPDSELSQEAQRLADPAKLHGTALFESQRQAAATEIGSMVDALRHASRALGAGQHDTTAQLAERAADSLDRFATTLRERDLHALLDPVESYARRHPGLFFGGSVALGVVLAQLLKSQADAPESGVSRPPL